MALFGILKEPGNNTGIDSEIDMVFSTPLTVNSNQPVLAADTISLKRKTMGQRGQRWEIITSLAPTVGSKSFLVHSVAHGHEKAFRVRMPQIPKSPYSDLPLTVSGNYAKGAITIGYASAGYGELVAGEFISFEASHKKVYLVLSVDAGTNQATIFPPLLAAVGTGLSISHGNAVSMYGKYETSTGLGMTFVDGLLMDPGTITIVEDLNAQPD